MQLTFRQGIIRQQKTIGGQPNFLIRTPSGININVVNEPLVVSLSHGTAEYAHQELASVAHAWTPPFSSTGSNWLYIDIDLLTATRTFGSTTLSPFTGATSPANPQIDQHWYDTTTHLMKVWNGTLWVIKIRVFVGILQNGVILVQYTEGSTVGVNVNNIRSGFIIFDENSDPIKRYDRYNQGTFITTETPLATQFARVTNYRIEGSILAAQATEYIAKHRAVCMIQPNQLSLARNTNPDYPAIGISSEDMHPGEVRSYLSSGYVEDPDWDWSERPNTKLFVDNNGELTIYPPQNYSIQEIATIVDPHTILLKVGPCMRYL